MRGTGLQVGRAGPGGGEVIYQYDCFPDDSSVFRRESGGLSVELTESGSITQFVVCRNPEDAKKVTDVLNELLLACGRRRVENP